MAIVADSWATCNDCEIMSDQEQSLSISPNWLMFAGIGAAIILLAVIILGHAYLSQMKNSQRPRTSSIFDVAALAMG